MLSNPIYFVICILYHCIHGKVQLGYSKYNQSLLLLMQSVCSSASIRAVIQVFLDNLTFFKVIQVVFVRCYDQKYPVVRL